MSAAQPKSAEPSMEEILASIRKIISDDQPGKATAPVPPPVQQSAPRQLEPIVASPSQVVTPVAAPVVQAKPIVHHDDDDDIMDLAPKPVQRIKAPEPQIIHDDPIPSDVVFEDPAPQPVVPASVAPPAAMSKQDELDAIMAEVEFDPTPQSEPAFVSEERLVSPTTDRMVSTAFSSLASTVLANNSRTLESLVEEMMRPMIKNWLDDNLPTIVERLIKSEIERVARGGR
jgi:uncharacterized protein